MKELEQREQHELIELAAEDALGLLSDKDRAKFEEAINSSSPEIQAQIRETRDTVMREVQNSLPEVDPEPSLKHRVMARIMQLIERDYGQTVQGAGWGSDAGFAVDRRDWMERLVAGRVSPFWRVAALILATTTVYLLFTIIGASDANHDLRQILRDMEASELFEKQVGPATLDFIVDYRTEHIVMAPIEESSDQRGLLSYYPATGQGLLLAAGLTNVESQYRIYVSAEGVDQVVITFQGSGEVVAIDFEVPNGISPLESTWWVAEIDADGRSERIFESIS